MLDAARAFLVRKEIEEARLEGELLVAGALGLSRLELFMQLERPVTAPEVDAARDALVRRGRREPVAYITGSREFYGRDFQVSAGVLIPRPETELLVDLVRDWARGREHSSPLRLADLGCGSGCLALTLALELESPQVLAVDLAPAAVEATRRNAERLGATCEVLLGDGLELLLSLAPFTVLVSNPPYIEPKEAAELPPDVREFEPELALFAPEGDPDFWLRSIVEALPRLIEAEGRAFVELGWQQSERALELAREAGLQARLHDDLARIPRVIELGL